MTDQKKYPKLNEPSIEVVEIGPSQAAEILEGNVSNRLPSSSHVKFLSSQMENGQWKFTGDPIRIGEDGRLLDGQHRLLAIIMSGTSQRFVLMSEFKNNVFHVLDTGKSRNAGDVLSIQGFKNANATAAIARQIINYKRNGKLYFASRSEKGQVGGNASSSLRISNGEILDFVNNNDISSHVDFAKIAYTHLRVMSPSEYGILHYILSNISQDYSERFFDKLIFGVNLDKDDVVLALRNKLIEGLSSGLKVPGRVRLGMVFRAWNHFRRGTTTSRFLIDINAEIPFPI